MVGVDVGGGRSGDDSVSKEAIAPWRGPFPRTRPLDVYHISSPGVLCIV